jgi:hypothetical protein
VLFGIGAAVTVVLIGVILDPATGLPLWLAYVLLPLFSLIAWVTLKPVRRVTSFAGHTSEPFQDGASLGHASDKSKQLGKRAVAGTAAAVTAGASAAAAALVASKHDEDDKDDEVAERAEARTTTTGDDASPQSSPPRPSTGAAPAPGSVAPSRPTLEATGAEPWSGSRTGTSGTSASAAGRRSTGPSGRPDESWESPASRGSAALGLVPVEPERSDGEEVYAIYRADEPELDEWGDPVPSESVQLDPHRPDQARGSDS